MGHQIFSDRHDDPEDCQIFIALTGSSESISLHLKKISEDIKILGAPMVGMKISSKCIQEIKITKWNNKKI